MNEIVPFTFDTTTVRTVNKNGEAWFVARDVATALGYTNTSKAIQDHCKGVPFRYPLQTPGGVQHVRLINEPDMYRLIASSKLPTAVEFERKVFEEVIPSIRRHGAYLTDMKIEEVLTNPDTIITLATQLKEARAREAEKAAQLEAQAPKVLFADSVAASKSAILVGELAKILRGNGVNIGQNRLFAWLRENGYLISRKGESWNSPTQYAMNLGLFQIKESTHTQPDGAVRITRTTKITGKGQQFFINKFLEQEKKGD